MFRIAHMSDVHLDGVPKPSLQQLLSKRVIGYINWRGNRAQAMTTDHLDRLVADIKAQAPDHIAVTGDLTNIALPGEFENARDWLQTLGASNQVSVIPGNHDAYVPGAGKLYRRLWAPWMSDDRRPESENAHFPYLRRLDRVALIGVSTAIATPPFMATGRIGRKQMSDLRNLLQQTGDENLFRIVLIHHPPKMDNYRRTFRRLTDGRRLRAAIRRTGAELILHGHDHIAATTALEGPGGPVPVIGVPAASHLPAAGPGSGGYALHDIERTDDGYALTVTRRGFDPAGTIVQTEKTGFSLPLPATGQDGSS